MGGVNGLGDKRIILGGSATSEENKMANAILSNIGRTWEGESPGWYMHIGVLVLKAGRQPEIAPAYKRAAVKKIQVILKVLGLLPADAVPNGSYGPQTKKAVKKFQNMIGVVGSKDGDVIGKHTVDALMRALEVYKGSGDVSSWQKSLIYIATGVKLDPPIDQIKDVPPSVEKMLIRRITESGHFKDTLAGRTTIYYDPDGVSQENKILKTALWIIGMDMRGSGRKVYTAGILNTLRWTASDSDRGGGSIGQESLNVIIRALNASYEATVKGLNPYERADYIEGKIKGTWGK